MNHVYNNLSDEQKVYCDEQFVRYWPAYEPELYGVDFKFTRLNQIARGCILHGIFVV